MIPENILRIMVATDSHLGYAEKDAIRGNDSFVAFEEMLELAVLNDVDFILLGGDLFHDAVPSQNAMHKCVKLLRTHTFGDKPISLEIISDQSVNFSNAVNETVNYEDPNLNISIPVFSIHGNHDDPSGFGRLSSLDILSTTGLVNYFGRWTDLSKIEINPILIRKGETQLALYGLSHIHDARLARLFENCNVAINCPGGELEDREKWFHLMVLHQNRADRGPKNYVPEEILPNFLNLIIWGHEHDCRIEPEYNHSQDFYISQPGSSVATSLSEGEALPKHVAILEIHGTQFKLKPLPLRTVRPFVFDSIDLSDPSYSQLLDEGDLANNVKVLAIDRVHAMIERAKSMLTIHPKQPTLPLIRLRLIYSDEAYMFNTIRFGNMFQQKVANPNDIIHFKKITKRKQSSTYNEKTTMANALQDVEIAVSARVEDLIGSYFKTAGENGTLKLVTPTTFAEMTYRLVERQDENAAENIISLVSTRAVGHLMEKLPGMEDISESLNDFKDLFSHDDMLKVLDDRGSINNVIKSEVRKPTDPVMKSLTTTTKTGGTSRGRGRGSRGVNNNTCRESSRPSRVMPPLDVSVNSARPSTRKQTLLDFVGDNQKASRTTRSIYLSSDNSE